jgi:hypothetical protein
MRVEQPYGKRYAEDSFSEEPEKRYFIACEGRRTEYQYFKGIMEFRDDIGILPLIEIILIKHDKNTGSNPLNIYIEAKKALKFVSNFFPGDQLCIVADRDKHSFTKAQYQKLVDADAKKDIQFCITNPCIEFWLLLHFCTASEYDKAALLKNQKIGKRTQTELYLKDKLGGKYNKRTLHFAFNYKDKIKIAIQNSKLYTTDCKTLENEIGTNLGLFLEGIMA